jgi:hypothetical protein
VLETVDDAPGDGRVGLAEGVIGLGQPVLLGAADGQADHGLEDLHPHPDRQPRVVRQLVGGPAEEVLRHDPRAPAGGEERALGDVRGLDRDVHRAVAHPEDDDAPARELLGLAVVVGVHLGAGERVVPGEARLGPARVPVVAVGDEQGVEALGRPVVELELPHAVGAAAGVLDARPEADRLAQAEVVGVGVEVLGDLGVVRVVRIRRRHREVRELHPLARRVDVQAAVGRREPVAVAEDPDAADPVGGLEHRVRDAALAQRLRRRDPGRARADHRRRREARHGGSLAGR